MSIPDIRRYQIVLSVYDKDKVCEQHFSILIVILQLLNYYARCGF